MKFNYTEIATRLFVLLSEVLPALKSAQRRALGHAMRTGHLACLKDDLPRQEESSLSTVAELVGPVYGVVLTQRGDHRPRTGPFWTHEFRADAPNVLYSGHEFDDYAEAIEDFHARCRKAFCLAQPGGLPQLREGLGR